MLVTAQVPHIGSDHALEIAKFAQREGATLRNAALTLGEATAADSDQWVQLQLMVRNDAV